MSPKVAQQKPEAVSPSRKPFRKASPPLRTTVEPRVNRYRTAVALGGLILVSLSACDATSRSVGPSVRDSLGVTIVDHGDLDLAALPKWSLGADPVVSIGVVDGDEAYQFYDVIDAHRRRDGSIVVVDRSFTLRAFDSLGVHLWTAGKGGDGPGEFRWPQMVTEIGGDSLVVWDPVLNRLHVFAPDGSFARTRTVSELAGGSPSLGLAAPHHLLTEYRNFERATINGHAAITNHSDLFLVDLRGDETRHLGREFLVTEFPEVSPQGAFSPAIFDAPAVFAAASGGYWYGDTKDYEVRLTTASGVKLVLRWTGADRTISEADFDAVLRLWAGGPNATPKLKQFISAYGRTHPRSEQFPAYEELRTDAQGRLWVRDFVREHMDDGFRRWTVFSPDGTEVLGRISHSDTFRPLQIGADWILGVQRDDLDVERVVVRAIVR